MIGHDIAAALPELRAQAESLMVNVCDIHRASAGWDEANQETTVTWASVHAGVPCTLLPPSQSDREIITDEGVARFEAVGRERSARFDQRMVDFSDAELSQLVDLMVRYNQALGD